MATGTGNLPNQDMSFSPFAILTAEEMNDLVENIESLADGSGVGDGAVTAEKLGKTVHYGEINGNSGSFSETGVGFKPTAIQFTLRHNSDTNLIWGQGTAFDNGSSILNHAVALYAQHSANKTSTTRYTADSIVMRTSSDLVVGRVTSMDSDGFSGTFSVTRNEPIGYIAWA